MRILWLSMTPGLLHEGQGTGNYGGSGWIGALQHLFCNAHTKDKLALSFISDSDKEKVEKNGVLYYPIYEKPENSFKRIYRYYYGYKSYNRELYVKQLLDVIHDYKPDIIHLFGLENPLATILNRTNIPIVVHIQGLLGPCSNAFYPSSFSRSSLIWPPTRREWLFRNGFLYAKKTLDIRAVKESDLFKDARYFMGRTEWDLHLTKLMSSKALYYKVNEALRPMFYDNAGMWKYSEGKFIITSTISETIYKGLDLILKTAKILKHETNLDFEWNVVGVSENSNIVRFFEHSLQINSKNVNVIYVGVMNAENLINNSLKSSVYVHPSYIDNSPNSICEAQLLGLPIIATNVGGVSSLIQHKENGILVPANEPYETAFWLKELSEKPAMALTFSQNGISTAIKRHDRNQILKDLLDSYKQIISKI